MEQIRLQKYFTDCGVMSRRAAEEEILAGNVKVNGELATLGQKITPFEDRVEYKGKVIKPRRNDNYKYIMLNKPRGYVTSMSDEKGRKCIPDLIKGVDSRVYPIGRLDLNSDGLLLLTDDGELANMLTHPKHEIPKYYHVKVKGEISSEAFAALGRSMEIDGYKIQPVKLELLSKGEDGSLIKMTLFEGRNRQIRKMCEEVGLDVIRLRRVAIGKIELGDLAPGKWKYLSREQVNYLKSEATKNTTKNSKKVSK